ncbi:MAG: spore cortex biosynthesis protein YabQ [Clostridia bacterium]|nr:spore cortex biosynthesis protein YabQ [Clostridia bacterium]
MYDFLYCVRYPFTQKWVRILTDVVFWIFFAALYLFVTLLTGLPDLRFFTFIGCVLGLFLYLKSFHKIVAFLAKKVYNSFDKIRKGRSRCSKEITQTAERRN